MNPEPYPDEDRRARPARIPASRKQKITVLIVWLVLAGGLAAVVTPAIRSFMFKGRMAGNLCRARILYLTLRNYASEDAGTFPTFKDRQTNAELLETSSEAF